MSFISENISRSKGFLDLDSALSTLYLSFGDSEATRRSQRLGGKKLLFSPKVEERDRPHVHIQLRVK